jgi:hypothetical protein
MTFLLILSYGYNAISIKIPKAFFCGIIQAVFINYMEEKKNINGQDIPEE